MSFPNIRTEAFHTVAASDAPSDGFVVPCYLADLKRRVAIARVGARLYAFDDLCPCGGRACPLSGGLLTGATILCQCHGSRFDVVSGSVVEGPAIRALNVHEVEEGGDGVRIRLSAGAT